MANTTTMSPQRTLGGRVCLWYLCLAVLGAIASTTWNAIWWNAQYVQSPADLWMLVGALTATSVNMRLRYRADHNNNNNEKLVIATDAALQQIVVEYALTPPDDDTNATSTTLVNSYEFDTGDEIQQLAPEYHLYAIQVGGLEPRTKYYYGIPTSSSTNNQSTTPLLYGTFSTPAPVGTRFPFRLVVGSNAWTGSRAAIFHVMAHETKDPVAAVVDHQALAFVHLGGLDGDATFHDDNTLGHEMDRVSTVLNSNVQATLYRQMAFVYVGDAHDHAASYPIVLPHYPLEPTTTTTTSSGNTTTTTNNDNDDTPPLHQAFTIGRARMLILDSTTTTTTNNDEPQKAAEWLLSELTSSLNDAALDFILVLSSSSHHWTNNPDVIELLANNNNDDTMDAPQVILLSGDQLMTHYGRTLTTTTTDNNNNNNNNNNNKTIAYVPWLNVAPLDRVSAYTSNNDQQQQEQQQCWGYQYERTQQYTTLTFSDDEPPCVTLETFRVEPLPTPAQERLFLQRHCPGQAVLVEDDNDTSSCQLELASPITLTLVYITGGLAALTSLMTLGMVGVYDGGRSTENNTNRGESSSCCHRWTMAGLSVAMVWLGVAVNLLVGAFVVPMIFGASAGNSHYEWRPSLVVSSVQTLVMLLGLPAVICCGRRKRQADNNNQNTGGHKKGASAVLVDEHQFHLFPVKRQSAKIRPCEDNLPLGILLTGGAKLRQAGWTGTGIKVAVIDSGVDETHPGFAGQVTHKTWYREGTPLTKDDHGTHVAGTIHLMAPAAEIYDYRVFGASGDLSVDQAIVKAIREATDAGCQVINMSLGGPFPNSDIHKAIKYAVAKNVVICCAAGNEGDNNPLTNEVSYPAGHAECISVAAVSKRQGFPVAVFSNSNSQVDYAGIGVDVNSFKPGGGFQQMSGTSMASPHCAGLVACLLSGKEATAKNIRKKLNAIAIDIDAVGIDNATGVGFASYLDEGAFDTLLPRDASKF